MEPVSLIVTALTAGAVAAAKDTAEKGGSFCDFPYLHLGLAEQM